MKKCKRCGQTKHYTEFHSHKKTKDGLASWCKECVKENNKNWRKDHPGYSTQYNKIFRKKYPEYHKQWQKDNDHKFKESQKKWRDEHKEETKVRMDKWREENPDQLKKNYKIWKDKNRDRINKDKRERLQNDPIFNLQYYMADKHGRLLRKILNGKKVNVRMFIDFFGCTPQELINYIESQFVYNMSWDNIVCDHIIPLSSGKSEEEIKRLCHYKNLQPLPMELNSKKGNKLWNKKETKQYIKDFYKNVK